MDQNRDAPDVLTRTLDLGWRAFLSAWILLVVASLAIIASVVPGTVIGAVGDVIHGALKAAGTDAGVLTVVWILGQVVSYGVSMLLSWPMQVGAGVAAVRASRGHTQEFGAIFAGFRRFPAAVGAMFLYTLLAALVNAPGILCLYLGLRSSIAAKQIVISGSEGAWLALGLVWTTVLGLWLAGRLMIAPLRAADPDLPKVGAFAAISETWAATRGHALAGVATMILSSIAMVVGLFCCCIGVVLLGMPLWLGLQAGFYRAVFAHAEPPPPPPAPAWTGATPPTSPDF
jgi:hypothetical protein